MAQLKAEPNGCEEAHDSSRDTYIPCNLPATHMIIFPSGHECRVCAAHHFHATKNRGAKDLGAYTPSGHASPAEEAEPVYDYAQFTEKPKTEGELGQLADLAEQAREAEYAVEAAQRELKRLQDLHRNLTEQQIPEIMDRVGMEKFKTSTGLEIDIKETIRASLGSGPEKDRNLDWLEEEGHEAIIKLAVTVPFGRGADERNTAKELAKELVAQGHNASFERKVEPSTLSALIRELLEDGREVPEEAFHVFRQRTAKIK